MRLKSLIGIILWGGMLVSCGPDNRVVLAEKLMAEKETDSAIVVMNEIKEPLHNLSKRDYALYALLMSEAVHRKQQLNAATDTLLLPAIKYFSQSGDSLYAERALYCKAHLDRRLNRMSDAMQSFLKALLFLQNSGNHEQLYRVNTWLGVVCLNQEEYSGKVRYSKEALKAALDLGNMFYKNMALCDISTGYLFLNQLDSALYYAQAAYEAALADSVPQQLPFIYTNLGSIYSQKGEPTKALDYINKSISLRPAKDTVRILSLYGVKLELFGKLGQYDSAYHYFQKVISSPNPSSVADAYNNMAKIYHKMGRASDAYPMLQRFIELSDTIRKYRHTEEAIALQELYKHEQLSVENLYWRTRAAERQRNVYWMTTISLLLVWVASAVYFIYRRNRNRLMAQQHQLVKKEKELAQQREITSENLRRMVELEQKEAKLKETFFRRLSQKVVQEIERGGNVILSDEDWDDITEVNSHPIALMQCREFLNQHPQLKVVEGEDTARSAEAIKNGNLKGHAAICSKIAAERYGMKVLQEGIETNKHNFTRFLVVADPWQVDELRQHRTNTINKANMVFTLPHSEGSLSQVLSILSFYNINLTKIQSLPIIGREWEYQFYVDVAFNDYLRYKQSIAAITPLTKELKILGEYAEGKSNV